MRKLNNNELERITVQDFKNQKKIPLTIILDDIRSAHNVGSIFRTSDAFLIKKIILCGITASPPNRGIYKSSLGSTKSVEWEYRNDKIEAIKELKDQKNYIIGVEQTEKSCVLNELEIEDKSITIILGNEVNGVSQDAINLCDKVIEIPQFGTKHSLNVSVAAGLVIWEIYKKLKL